MGISLWENKHDQNARTYNRHESVEIDFGPIEIIVCTSVISVILVILPRQ